jgi:hypothetical protein
MLYYLFFLIYFDRRDIMKKIVPFKKELFFKNNIAEITSISLEHTLHHEEEYLITGDFIISGEYRVTDVSLNTEKFDFKIPFDINVDEKYIMDKVVIDIDDFYYEIINSNSLLINVEVMIDKLEEKEEQEEKADRIELTDIIEDTKDDITAFITNTKVDAANIIEDNKKDLSNFYQDKGDEIVDMKDNFKNNVKEYVNEKKDEVINKVKDKLEEISEFITYRIYILREEDNVDTVVNKYNVSREILEQYNNLGELKVGDKIIIPTNE